MPTGPITGPGEDPGDVVAYVRALGHAVSLEQLDRLVRRGLVVAPTPTGFAPGTAERVARIAELRATARSFDEVAWRLWWEGFAVEPRLVRTFLERRAAHWDDLVAGDEVDEPAPLERDVLEDVFFRHLKRGGSVSSGRRSLERGAATYLSFSRLLVELEAGALVPPATPVAVAGPLAGLAGEGDLDFTKAATGASDVELARARLVARRLFALIVRVGTALARLHGAGHSDAVGRTLLAMTESANEQVLAVVLAATDESPWPLDDPGDLDEPPRPAIDFATFVRLGDLAKADPLASRLLEPERLAGALASSEGLAAWWAEAAPLAGPGEAAGEGAVPAPEGGGEAEESSEGLPSKKKIQNDPGAPRARGARVAGAP
ncbi:MAG: hypothetical protein ACYCRG_10020 [Acidimicrobiales bacterium]